MLGTIIKLAILVIIVLIALNIFAPEQADKILSTVSDKTNIDKSSMQEKLDKATQVTKDTINEATTAVQKKLEE